MTDRLDLLGSDERATVGLIAAAPGTDQGSQPDWPAGLDRKSP